MTLVILTALGVGGATLLGGVIGLFFRKLSHKGTDAVLGFAAGVMLGAAVLGLIVPAAALTGNHGLWLVVLGVLLGAVFLNLCDRLTPHLHHITGIDAERHRTDTTLQRVTLFVLAIAIHNLPEGLAAGVGFGGGDVHNALLVALGIALQNIPEGMIVIPPLLLAGVKPGRALTIAAATGVVEVAGTFLGYAAASLSAAILPFMLAFAGGTMLYVISDEMIPETHSHGYERLATYALLVGFLVMLLTDRLLG